MLAVLAAALLAAGSPHAEEAVGASPSGYVEWLQPPGPTYLPLSEAAKEHGRQKGRALPTPEFLQPSLDPALPAYTPTKGARLSGRYVAAASDVLPDLANAWIDAFRKHHPNVEIEVRPPFAGSLGAKELVKGAIDFVFVSRELKPEDLTDFRARFGYDPLSVPISGGSYRHYGFLDAVAVIVHKDNPIERITFDQLDAAFSKTRHRGARAVATWGDLGLTGEWADRPIRLYGIKPWNGFEEFVRQRVLSTGGRRGEWRDDVNFADTVFPVAGKVAQDKYALAYDGIAYLDRGVRVLPVAADANGPFSAPTYENVARADYPLSRLIFLNINKPPGKALEPAVQEFLRFILSREGQAVVQRQGLFLPLRAHQAADGSRLLDR